MQLNWALCGSLTPVCVVVWCAATTRVQRNKNFAKLQAGYLFPEVRAAAGADRWA